MYWSYGNGVVMSDVKMSRTGVMSSVSTAVNNTLRTCADELYWVCDQCDWLSGWQRGSQWVRWVTCWRSQGRR